MIRADNLVKGRSTEIRMSKSLKLKKYCEITKQYMSHFDSDSDFILGMKIAKLMFARKKDL